MYGVIDRIEEGIVVIEFDNDSIEKVDIKIVKGEVKEGNVLYKEKEIYIVDIIETEKRRKEAEELLDAWE